MKYSLFTLVVLQACSLYGQTPRNFKQEANQLRQFLSEHHVEPVTINDEYSVNVFTQIIQELDPDKLFFTQQDIDWLAVYKASIDDELNGKNWVFLNRLKERYQSSLERVRFNIQEILKEELDWRVREAYHPASSLWEKDEIALRNRQRMFLKSEILNKISWFMERDSVNTPDAINIYEQEAVQHVRKIQLRGIDDILNYPTGYDNYVGLIFFEAITTVFDPHTLYLSATDFQNFTGSLATEDFYFGFTIDDNEDGDITIVALAPGGPAWKSGEMQISDVLVAVKSNGRESIDLNGMSIDEVNALLDQITDHELEFTIKKADGVKKTVKLKKEKMEAEENFVRSFILSGSHHVGYIHLPDFYTRWNETGEGSQCANDVAKEILKLKKDSIEGLILDVRYNGGGSLFEALAMAGIFIDEGALGILKDHHNEVTVLKDVNRGTVYDGPLIIMVNGQSASASEFLAAAIQDYNRGLIVGSRTYGKGTGQNILPLNSDFSPETALTKGAGFVKVTTERIYRVTGGSVQAKGVTPDIELPDMFSIIDLHESAVPFSLPPDSIARNTYYKTLPAPKRKELRQRSALRVLSDPVFQQLAKSYAWYAGELEKEAPVSLSWQEFLKNEQELAQQETIIRKVYSPSLTVYEVKNNTTEEGRLKTDSYAAQYNRLWTEKLKGDLYLSETFQIMGDLIDLNKKP
jgi:carboxyl-terminal processing protease